MSAIPTPGAVSEVPPAIPSASLIVFRHGAASSDPPQLLMTSRSPAMRFAPGAAVFPGGRVEAGDHELAAALPGDRAWNVARVAAIRETLEEVGLLIGVTGPVDAAAARSVRGALRDGCGFGDALASAGLAIDPDALAPFARWMPPARLPRRFDTRFFLADIGTGAVDLSADGDETTEHFWASANEVLAMQAREEIALVFPTIANLRRLARLGDFATARADAAGRAIETTSGEIFTRDGVEWLMATPGRGYDDFAMPLKTAHRG